MPPLPPLPPPREQPRRVSSGLVGGAAAAAARGASYGGYSGGDQLGPWEPAPSQAYPDYPGRPPGISDATWDAYNRLPGEFDSVGRPYVPPSLVGVGAGMTPVAVMPNGEVSAARRSRARGRSVITASDSAEMDFNAAVAEGKAASAYTVAVSCDPTMGTGARLPAEDTTIATCAFSDDSVVPLTFIAATSSPFAHMSSWTPGFFNAIQTATIFTADACTTQVSSNAGGYAYAVANFLLTRVVGFSLSLEQDGAATTNAGNWSVVDGDTQMAATAVPGAIRAFTDFDTCGSYGETGSMAALSDPDAPTSWAWQPSGENPQGWFDPGAAHNTQFGSVCVLLRAATATTVTVRVIRRLRGEGIALPAGDAIEIEQPLATMGVMEDVRAAAGAFASSFGQSSTFAAARKIAERAKSLWLKWRGPLGAAVSAARAVGGLLAAQRATLRNAHALAHCRHLVALAAKRPDLSPYANPPTDVRKVAAFFYEVALRHSGATAGIEARVAEVWTPDEEEPVEAKRPSVRSSSKCSH